MSEDKKVIDDNSPPNNLTKGTGGPMVPVCDKCKQPLTKCKCHHNSLQK